MKDKRNSLVCRLIVVVMFVAIETKASNEVGERIKKMLEEAGCPFISRTQLLVRNVCLMPDYHVNELPTNSEGVTNVNLFLLKVRILQIEEKKNKITIELSQNMDWTDQRIRASFRNNDLIKLSPKTFLQIWHPDLDMFTTDLEEWKSLYDPLLFEEMVVYQNNRSNLNFAQISVYKNWKATIYCKFDFSLFPLDTQLCTFMQWGSSEALNLLLRPPDIPEPWKETTAGFDVIIRQTGSRSENNGTWSGDVGLNITLKRVVQRYLYEYYFPCIAIVIVSQISFIIPLSAIPGRVALVVTQFLTLTNIFIHQMVSRKNLNTLHRLYRGKIGIREILDISYNMT